MEIEQFVMAYGVEQDRIRAILPEGYTSLRPVLRINAEIHKGIEEIPYIEFNTAVEADGKRGWLNIGNWHSSNAELFHKRDGKAVTFTAPFLEITFTAVGIEGECPAEKDNEGCFFIGERTIFHTAEKILSNKEFCDCKFSWKFGKEVVGGKSIGKTLPALPTEPKKIYDKQEFTVQNAATIPCDQVLGSYVVKFQR